MNASAKVIDIGAAHDLRGAMFNRLRRIVNVGLGRDRAFVEIERLT
jgi:hypothetical protein